MLTRFISKPLHLRLLACISSHNTLLSNAKSQIFQYEIPSTHNRIFLRDSLSNHYRCFSTNGNGDGNGRDEITSKSDVWKLSSDVDQSTDSVFGKETGSLEGIHDGIEGQNIRVPAKPEDESWLSVSDKGGVDDDSSDIFKGIDEKGSEAAPEADDDWRTAEGFKPWDFVVEEKEEVFDSGVVSDVGFQMSEIAGRNGEVKSEKSKEDMQLEREEKALTEVLKGPNRAFGDLISASGITEEMLDSLLALKDLSGIRGLPPLREIEVMRCEKNTSKSTRAEMERQKQEEVAKSRVRQVDEKGRAYGTGKRKCSIARVWVQPGDGQFVVNDKQFDVYFPMLDHRAALLRPFVETKTLGLWDVNCTVKGGGVSGQVGAIRLGISRALQNWEPDLRPPLRQVGFLTRDSRIVERKKPGKAKARKSFQWVKR